MKDLRKNVLQMDNKEARNFFLKSESYFTAKLPEYIDFNDAISSAKKILTSKNGQPKDINDIADKKEYPNRDDLNYTLFKRKIVIIHGDH